MHRLVILPRWPYMVLLFATLLAFVSHQSSETAMSIPKSFWKPYCVMMTPNIANVVYVPNFFWLPFFIAADSTPCVLFNQFLLQSRLSLSPCYRMDETRPFGVEKGEKTAWPVNHLMVKSHGCHLQSKINHGWSCW